MRSFLRLPIPAILLSAWLLAACGQTGPLYLPVKPAPEINQPAGASTTNGEGANTPANPSK